MTDDLTDRLRRSAEDIGELYPVLVDEEGNILDGRSRIKANPKWRKTLIEGLDEEKKLKIKHHANWHRKDFNRTKALMEIAETTGWRGLKPFAEFLKVSEKTISRYLPEKYKLKHDSSHKNLSGCQVFENFDFGFSVWNALPERPEGYGSKEFRGNCSPTVIFGLLSKYSQLNDVVFDPMAGSGTFIDVARAMGYESKQIIVRDIFPKRDDIDYGDAEQTNLPDESVDFIFAHFPYWTLIQYTSDNVSDLSNLAYKEFCSKTERIMREMHRILKKRKFFTVMIGNLRRGGILDLEATFSLMGSKYFTLWDKVIKIIRTWKEETRGQRMGLEIARAKAHNRTVVNHDTLLVFRKDS